MSEVAFAAPFESLNDEEKYWRDKYPWLLDSGYQLRPRYKPDWVPSWISNPRLEYVSCEDAIINDSAVVCDALRIDENTPVMLKRISHDNHPNELTIVKYLMREPLKSDSNNHCVPSIAVLQPPDEPSESILVMPLCREWNSPEFETSGEAVDCIHQLLEGVKFLHENRIAHRDIKSMNFMMDTSLYTQPFHPRRQDRSLDCRRNIYARYTRTQKRPKYYIIDFGLSHQYEESQMPPMEVTGMFGSDLTVPEFDSPDEPHDPFPIDIYCLGNMIQNGILEGDAEAFGFPWIVPLIKDMTDRDPSKRPAIAEVVTRFNDSIATLSTSALRSRFAPAWDHLEWHEKVVKTVPYWLRKVQFVLTRTPALPTDKKTRSGVKPT